jgi:hypothetical protein
MAQDVNNVAEPSAAAPEKVQYTGWDEHGTPIVEKSPEPPKKQDSAPAPATEKKSEPEPEGKSAAEPGAATKQESKGKQNAEERIAELISDRKRLEERLRKLESQPASKAEAAEEVKAVEPPKRPNPYTFKGTPEEFDKAMDDYETARDEYQQSKFNERQLVNARNQVFVSKVQEARERYGQEQFDTTIEAASKAIAEQALPTVKEYLQRSEMFADLLYVIGGTEKSLDDFLGSAKSDAFAAIRKLAYLEIEIGKELAKGKENKSAKSDDNSDDPNKKPAEKKETPAEPKPRAPKPPSEVGGRGIGAPDEEMAAARAGDFAAFEAEQKRRHFGAAK